MALMTGSTGDDGSFNLQPVCVFGTDIQNDSNKETLDFSWTAFKWSSSASDALIENQKVECTISITRDEPVHNTGNCDDF